MLTNIRVKETINVPALVSWRPSKNIGVTATYADARGMRVFT